MAPGISKSWKHNTASVDRLMVVQAGDEPTRWVDDVRSLGLDPVADSLPLGACKSPHWGLVNRLRQ